MTPSPHYLGTLAHIEQPRKPQVMMEAPGPAGAISLPSVSSSPVSRVASLVPPAPVAGAHRFRPDPQLS